MKVFITYKHANRNIKRSMFLLLISSFLVLGLSACGTTSGFKSTDEVKTNSQGKKAYPLTGYDRVIVRDLKDTSKSAVNNAGKRFSDLIAIEIKETKTYTTVSRKNTKGKAVVVEGDITRYEDGNAALRLLIGMGAGSSQLDADIRFLDNETGKPIGDILVDKNSWFLGGVLAAVQDADSHMSPAAKKIASELTKAKTGKSSIGGDKITPDTDMNISSL